MSQKNLDSKEKVSLNVQIDQQLMSDLHLMSKNSGKEVSEIVEVALKRFRSSHADYMGIKLDYP
jgi:hypothetical protein